MTLEDMTDLIIAHDGITMVEQAALILCDTATAAGYEEGALGKLSHLYDIILRNSRFKLNGKDMEDVVDEEGRCFTDILYLEIPAEERAKLMLG